MAKRVVDLIVGGLLFAASLPVVLILALVLAVELRSFPFFVQERIGQGGRVFRFIKLRTLPPSTPQYALKYDLDQEALSPLRAFLRRRHLDELPQLWHVLVGDLSLVGPRPRMPDAFEPVEAGYAEWRVDVPQGCTGLWQIGLHQDELPSEHPEYDRFYIAHQSVWLDLWILWQTTKQAIGLGAPVGLADIPARAAGRPVEAHHWPELPEPALMRVAFESERIAS